MSHLRRLSPIDRVRALLDERRYRDYERGRGRIFYRWQPFR